MIVDFNTIVGKSLKKRIYTTQRVGIELEYEHTSQTMPTLDNWRTEIDHSLRDGGMEYISTPLLERNIEMAVLAMIRSAKLCHARVTPRCGLHVHVNVTYMTWHDLFKFVTYYTLLEPALFAAVAPGREMSHFCVPTWANTALAEYMYKDSMKLRTGIRIPGTKNKDNWAIASAYLQSGGMGHGNGALRMLRVPKYTALNVASLVKFGTLEFRQAPSSLSPKFIIDWATLLLRIQREAEKWDDTSNIIAEYEVNGIRNLCNKVFFTPKGEIDEMNQEDAADAATIIAGHLPVGWQDLKWEVA